jgi:hypothetical protein
VSGSDYAELRLGWSGRIIPVGRELEKNGNGTPHSAELGIVAVMRRSA